MDVLTQKSNSYCMELIHNIILLFGHNSQVINCFVKNYRLVDSLAQQLDNNSFMNANEISVLLKIIGLLPISVYSDNLVSAIDKLQYHKNRDVYI